MNLKQKNFLYIACAVALAGLFGSMFMSEIMKLPPCTYCWWQRIAMYPLAVIFTVAIFIDDRRVYLYALPLSIFGWIFSLYHTLLQWGWIIDTTPCVSGVPCDDPQINLLGFITIPFMSFVAFTIINIALWLFIRQGQNK